MKDRKALRRIPASPSRWAGLSLAYSENSSLFSRLSVSCPPDSCPPVCLVSASPVCLVSACLSHVLLSQGWLSRVRLSVSCPPCLSVSCPPVSRPPVCLVFASPVCLVSASPVSLVSASPILCPPVSRDTSLPLCLHLSRGTVPARAELGIHSQGCVRYSR